MDFQLLCCSERLLIKRKKIDLLFVNRISLGQTVRPLNESIVNVAVLCFCCHLGSVSSLVSMCSVSGQADKQMTRLISKRAGPKIIPGIAELWEHGIQWQYVVGLCTAGHTMQCPGSCLGSSGQLRSKVQ